MKTAILLFLNNYIHWKQMFIFGTYTL